MGTHLDAVMKACNNALDEAKKLEKEFKAAKTAPEKVKLKKMAEAAKKIALAHFSQIDAAKEKDKLELNNVFKEMGI